MAPPLSKEMERKLHSLYYKEGFMFGRDKLFSLVKDLDLDISRRQISDWLGKQEVNQLYAPTRRAKIIQPTVLKRPYAQIGIDLADMQNDAFEYKYILTAIDLFSKYAWAEALKNKEAKTVAKAMEKILRRMDEKPSSIRSDQGSEFISDEFQKVLDKYGVKQVLALPGKPESNGQIERFIGILKRLLRKWMISNGSRKWEEYLETAVRNYNRVPSRVTQKAPEDIQEEDEEIEEKIRKEVTSKKDPTGKIYEKGDKVRVKLKTKDQSKKNWSKELYIIDEVRMPRSKIRAATYRIRDRKSGDLIEGRFYNNDLLRVNEVENEREEEEKYNVGKLVKYEVRKGVPGFIVKWKGYSDKYNTFEPLERLKEDVPKMVSQYFKKN